MLDKTEHVQHVQHVAEVGAVTAKVTPPVVVSGMVIAGYPLQDWLIVLTIIYTVIQIVLLLPKLWQMWRKR
jgi:hypothetical protein